jgi:branched-chain amino acid transport system ATP-binding protein
MLKLTDIETYYGKAQALKGITLEVKQGDLVTILGANGAGKTTLLRTITGLQVPRKGTIEFEGQRIDRLSPDAIVKMGISHCPEGRKLFPQMTVLKNLMLGAYVRRGDGEGIQETLEEVCRLFPILKERQHQLAGTLSGGEQQMLVISRALMSKPKLLLLDETSLGIAPMVVDLIFEVIKDINRKGTTIVVVEQNANIALEVAHYGYVLETGEIIISGESKTLLADEKVKEAYLG